MTPSWKIARCSLQFFAAFSSSPEDPLLLISFGSSDRQRPLVNLLESSEGLMGGERSGGGGGSQEEGEGVRRRREGVRRRREGRRRKGGTEECLVSNSPLLAVCTTGTVRGEWGRGRRWEGEEGEEVGGGGSGSKASFVQPLHVYYNCAPIANSTNRPVYIPCPLPPPPPRCVQAHLPCSLPQMCTGPLTLSPPSDVYRCAYLVPSRLPRRATEAENVFSSPVTCDEDGRAVQCRGPSVAPTSCGIHNRPHPPSMPQHH